MHPRDQKIIKLHNQEVWQDAYKCIRQLAHCLERLASDMTYHVSGGYKVISTHSVCEPVVCRLCVDRCRPTQLCVRDAYDEHS